MSFDWLPAGSDPAAAVGPDRLRAWLAERPGLPHRRLPGMPLDAWLEYSAAEVTRLGSAAGSWIGYSPEVPALAIAHPLEWDTRLVGMPVALLDWVLFPAAAEPARVAEMLRAFCRRAREVGGRLIIHKVAGEDVPSFEALGRAGFDLLTVHLDYLLDATRAAGEEHALAGFDLGPARPEEEEEIGELSAQNFAETDRFQVDRLIPREVVPAIYREWARNSLRGFADLVWVGRRAGSVRGFGTFSVRRALAERTGVRTAWYGLGAVAESERGRGLFRRITGGALARLDALGVHWVTGATNALNLPAQRSFASLGGWNQGALLTWRKDLGRE